MIFEQFAKCGVIPIVFLDDAKDAAPLAKVLCENNLPCAEIAFNTEAAEESIRIMTREFPDMLVGAGNILTTDQADKAINAGANFIVTPGIDPALAQYCLDESIPVTPGVQTPTEISQALELSLTVVNFFPVEPAGGLNLLKALAEVYDSIKFMPRGGITAKNLKTYLEYERVIACGGNWLVTRELIKAGEWDKIAKLVKEAVSIVKEVRD